MMAKKRPDVIVIFFQRLYTPDIKEDEKVGGHPWWRTVSQHVMRSTSSHSKKKRIAFFISWQRGYSSRPLDSFDFR